MLETGRKVTVISSEALDYGWAVEDIGVIMALPQRNNGFFYEVAPVTGKGTDTLLLTEEEFRALDPDV